MSQNDLIKFNPRKSKSFFEVFMPYCIERPRNTGDSYLVLNRRYKPVGTLGFWSSGDVEPIRVKIPELESVLPKVATSYNAWPRFCHLYGYTCQVTDYIKGFEAYVKRLKVLSRLKVITSTGETLLFGEY